MDQIELAPVELEPGRAPVVGLAGKVKNLLDTSVGNGQGTLTEPDQQGVGRDQRQRQADLDPATLPARTFDLDLSTQPGHGGQDRVHADAATGHLGGLVARGEAGSEQQSQQGPFVVGLAVTEPALLVGPGPDPGQVQAAAVVAALDPDLRSFAAEAQIDPAFGRLAQGDAPVGRLDAVVDRVAQDVHQRIDQSIQHVAVDPRVLALDPQADLLAGHPRGLADGPLQARHDGLHGDGPQCHHRFVRRAVETALGGQQFVDPGQLGFGLAVPVAETVAKAITQKKKYDNHHVMDSTDFDPISRRDPYL